MKCGCSSLPTHPVQKMPRAQRGLTLIELMIATAILSLALVGVGMSVYQTEYFNNFSQDRALANQAAQQVMETINQALFTALDPATGSWNNTTFTVGELSKSGVSGYVTTSDAGWDGLSDAAYRIVVEVRSTGGVVYAHLQNVRTQ